VFITLPSSIQNAGHTSRSLPYITCYFKEVETTDGVTNNLQHSQLELKMPCHALFLIPSTWRFGNAGLGYVQHDPVGLVWYGTSCMNFWWPLIFKHHT